MKFEHAVIPAGYSWSSPFVRWQGALADVPSPELAVLVTASALARRGVGASDIDGLVVGSTIPQANSFYLVPWLASRLNLSGLSGPHVAQACATSVACIVAAALLVERDRRSLQLVVATDRTSNGPLLVYPRSQSMGGSPATEHWVLDSFAADPNTGLAMVDTAEHVARDGGFSRNALDELTLLRWQQYGSALQEDRAVQRRYFEPVELPRGRGKTLRIEADDGVHAYTAESLAALKPVQPGGVVTFASQTHPADGCAGAVVTTAERARSLAPTGPVVRLLAAGFARAEKARMPKAATTAAQLALTDAGVAVSDLGCVVTHNPFAVNDLWFAQQTGFALERMNPYGCSLIYGHPQGPTGLRGIAELIQALVAAGGGTGLFTGCAAGDSGAALVLRVE
jgi:acetyl-CoA C-acetyltransferase